MDFIVNEVEMGKQARAEREAEKERLLPKHAKKPTPTTTTSTTTDNNTADKNTSYTKPPPQPVVLIKSTTDIMKRKLDKLMSDPTKEVYIPEPRKEWKPREPMEFVRDVMGSSAGAGSGEFHVYQNAKRREQKRLAYLDRKADRDDADQKFADQVEENKRKADEVTAKKREKRQRKKKKKVLAKKKKTTDDGDATTTDVNGGVDDASSDEDNGNDEDVVREEEEAHFVIGGK